MQGMNQPDRKAKGKNRIIIIGLDSADPDLVQMCSKDGRLPFITSLIESGVWVRLISTRGLFSDSPWPSFNTGVSPAKHAFYNFLQLKRGTTDIRRADARYCRYFPFWWLLRGAGKKAAVFDVPKTYPIEGIDGLQVAAWGEHYPLLKRSSLPTALCAELTARFGKYFHPKEIVNPKRISQETKIYSALMSDIEKKAEATQFLMAQENWDLFISVFAESHYGGHQLFHHSRPDHWAYDPKRSVKLGEALPKIYAQLDSTLAEIIGGAVQDATVFIVSVHGIATNYSANHLMPAVLEKLGFQVRPAAPKGAAGWFAKRTLLQAVESLIPRPVKELIREKFLPQSVIDRIFARHFSERIDWDRSKAFFLPSDHFQGFVSVNLKGREPWGAVEPGSEYREVCNRVCFELKRLINPETGKAAVRDTVQISEIYQGENLYLLPDVVIQWAEDAPISGLYHPKFGAVSNESFALRRSQHSANGFMIAAGKHIKKSAALNGASTMDLAPTFLYLLGETVPKDMDGKVLLDLIDEEFKKENPVRYGDRPLLVPEEMRL